MKYRAGVGQGEGCLPSIGGKTMEIRKCLDDLDAKHIFNFKIVKIGPHFFLGGGGGHAERKWWEKNGNQKCLDDFWSTTKSVFCKAIL